MNLLSPLMQITPAIDQPEWDSFLSRQTFHPFLQSWTMGEVYRDIGQEPIRLIAWEGEAIQGVCFGHIVPARRGKHLSVPYGPVLDASLSAKEQEAVLHALLEEIKTVALKLGCSFVRLSPFWPSLHSQNIERAINSPLHLLAEHLWYLPLTETDTWQRTNQKPETKNLKPILESVVLASMRSTTRNLIRRAEKDGVTIIASDSPERDLAHFIRLHDETCKRHRFTPYSHQFFEAQVRRFAERKELTLYLASFEGKIIAASIHMHAFGETSYHHGASDVAHRKVPASYLLQWRAICDALRRGDRIYNFWGIAPTSPTPIPSPHSKKHPFAGVTLFKTGFGGKELELRHCMDLPLSKRYWLTYGFETIRKWRRGF